MENKKKSIPVNDESKEELRKRLQEAKPKFLKNIMQLVKETHNQKSDGYLINKRKKISERCDTQINEFIQIFEKVGEWCLMRADSEINRVLPLKKTSGFTGFMIDILIVYLNEKRR